jgi:hypothetical protein
MKRALKSNCHMLKLYNLAVGRKNAAFIPVATHNYAFCSTRDLGREFPLPLTDEGHSKPDSSSEFRVQLVESNFTFIPRSDNV